METENKNSEKLNDANEIFDPVRKKRVALTPEESVRQNFISYLVAEKKYPLNLLRVEYALKLNGQTKRCDILACNRNGKPLLLVECKAVDVKITQSVFDQLTRYNAAFNVPFLVATNGVQTFCCKLNFETSKYVFLKDIPCFDEICK